MSAFSVFPKLPFIDDGNLIGKLFKGIGKVAKYAWDVITGQDKIQDEIASKKGFNPEKNEANEIADLNKLLVKYRQNISAAANDMEREMLVECSIMLKEIMDVFEEQNKALKLVRTESVKRKFNRASKELRGTFAEYVEKRFSLDDIECVKILKLPAGDLKNQRLQEMKQNVFIQSGNEIIKRIKDTVDDFSETIEDAFDEHLERSEKAIQDKTDSFEDLERGLDGDAKSLESVILKADYLIAVCSYTDTLT
ncbi:MAG: hypothetical protein NC340_06070 [Ruminococcus flavefaciens]|nr:hypothetical protein [Ruminococcus flavefaciens]MCM1231236.1 hypothetical protein [Ruminococcus flavefaciens]